MDFELSEEQRLFRDTIRDFVAKEIEPVASEWEATDRYPAEIVEGLKEMGLFGMMIPEEYGGLDLDFVTYAMVLKSSRSPGTVWQARWVRTHWLARSSLCTAPKSKSKSTCPTWPPVSVAVALA